MELGLGGSIRVAIDGRVAAPFLRRLAQHAHQQRVVGPLGIEARLDGEHALEHQPAGIEVGASQRGLLGEMRLAGLERSLVGLLEALGLGRDVGRDALVQRPPFLAQRADVFGERLGRFLHADQGLHFLDQLDALRRRDVVLPLPQLVEAGVELLEAARELRRQRRRGLQRLLDRLPEPRRLARVATLQRGAAEADQARDLAVGLVFRWRASRPAPRLRRRALRPPPPVRWRRRRPARRPGPRPPAAAPAARRRARVRAPRRPRAPPPGARVRAPAPPRPRGNARGRGRRAGGRRRRGSPARPASAPPAATAWSDRRRRRPVGELLERRADRRGLAGGEIGLAPAGEQRVVALLDELVGRLVLAAQAWQQLVPQRGVVDRRGSGLPHARGRAVDRQPREFGCVDRARSDRAQQLLVLGRIDRRVAGARPVPAEAPRRTAPGQGQGPAPCGTGWTAASSSKRIQDRPRCNGPGARWPRRGAGTGTGTGAGTGTGGAGRARDQRATMAPRARRCPRAQGMGRNARMSPVNRRLWTELCGYGRLATAAAAAVEGEDVIAAAAGTRSSSRSPCVAAPGVVSLDGRARAESRRCTPRTERPPLNCPPCCRSRLKSRATRA